MHPSPMSHVLKVWISIDGWALGSAWIMSPPHPRSIPDLLTFWGRLWKQGGGYSGGSRPLEHTLREDVWCLSVFICFVLLGHREVSSSLSARPSSTKLIPHHRSKSHRASQPLTKTSETTSQKFFFSTCLLNYCITVTGSWLKRHPRGDLGHNM